MTVAAILFNPRLLVVLALVFALALAKRLWAQRQRRIRAEAAGSARLPADLVAGGARTWVVFTTPYCASCGPVVDQLSSHDPGATVVTVDATRHAELARAHKVRAAPTVLLADRSGRVRERLVGADSVRAYLAAAAA